MWQALLALFLLYRELFSDRELFYDRELRDARTFFLRPQTKKLENKKDMAPQKLFG